MISEFGKARFGENRLFRGSGGGTRMGSKGRVSRLSQS